MEFIQYLIIGSLWCYGVYALFDYDHLFGPLGDWIESKLGENWIRPLFACPPCMSSVHGITIGFIVFGISWIIFPYIICLCGLNFIIKNIIFED